MMPVNGAAQVEPHASRARDGHFVRGDQADLQALLLTFQRRQRMIADFAKVAMEPKSVDWLLQEASLRAAEGLGVEQAKILKYRPETADLLIVAGVGWREGVVGTACLSSGMASPAGRAFQTGQSVLIDDISLEAGFECPPLLDEHGVISLVNVPLFVDGQTWGVLEADSGLPRDLTAMDADFLASFAGIVGAAIYRKAVETQAEAATAEIARLADQRKLLLGELQHRVKNNLQMILSLLEIEQRKINDVDLAHRFGHVADRVSAIALAHEQLVSGDGLGEVKIGAYLRALCSYIDPHREGLTIEATAQDIEISIEQAVPLGLIVNEAVTNALKYAFADADPGQVLVSFEVDGERGRAKLRIVDNGGGLKSHRPGSSGRSLIGALAAQIGGETETFSGADGGVTVEVDCPVWVSGERPPL